VSKPAYDEEIMAERPEAEEKIQEKIPTEPFETKTAAHEYQVEKEEVGLPEVSKPAYDEEIMAERPEAEEKIQEEISTDPFESKPIETQVETEDIGFSEVNKPAFEEERIIEQPVPEEKIQEEIFAEPFESKTAAEPQVGREEIVLHADKKVEEDLVKPEDQVEEEEVGLPEVNKTAYEEERIIEQPMPKEISTETFETQTAAEPQVQKEEIDLSELSKPAFEEETIPEQAALEEKVQESKIDEYQVEREEVVPHVDIKEEAAKPYREEAVEQTPIEEKEESQVEYKAFEPEPIQQSQEVQVEEEEVVNPFAEKDRQELETISKEYEKIPADKAVEVWFGSKEEVPAGNLEQEAVERIQEEIVKLPEIRMEDVIEEENPFAHNQVEEKPLDELKPEVEKEEEQIAPSSAKKVTKKGFNFRTNKNKIESILPRLETSEKEETQHDFERDMMNELGTPIELVKFQSSEVETPLIKEEEEEQQEQELSRQSSSVSEKASVKRGFNFRAKKSKIESVLLPEKKAEEEEVIFTEITKPQEALFEIITPQENEPLIKEIENFQVPEKVAIPQEQSTSQETEPLIKEIETIQAPEKQYPSEEIAIPQEQSLPQEIEPLIKEIETVQVPEKEYPFEEKVVELVAEEQEVKPSVNIEKVPVRKGFNFRANKSKVESIVAPVEILKTEELQPEIKEKEVVENENVEQSEMRKSQEQEQERTNEKVSSKRGFNFRTKKNKIEAMLTSVETPEKKSIEGSEKSSSGEFTSISAFRTSQEKPDLTAQETETLESQLVDQGSMEEKDLKSQLGGKVPAAKRSFNFRANNKRIDSILKKDSFVNREGGQLLDLSAENEGNTSNVLESTIDTSVTHSAHDDHKEKILGLREENILLEEEIEPQTKRRGFNFKNPKRKIEQELKPIEEFVSVQNQDENSSMSTEQPSEVLQETEGGKGEGKKPKGFNFRNSNRVKAE